MPVFACPICGFHYDDEKWAKECENWCRAHSSCSLEITKNALENQNDQTISLNDKE